MNRSIAPALLAALGVCPPGQADVLRDTWDIPSQNTVIVTASRIEQDEGAALAPVTVLERPDIDRLQTRDVVELLEHTPGADITRAGGPGADASLYLRGTNSDHTLFLIDGQRVSSATLGSTSFQLLDPEQIQRVEIVRGPRSSLYGSDAIGGVVQIFTRRPGPEPEAYVKAGYGNHDSSLLTAGGDGSWRQFRYAVNVSHYFTQGISDLQDKTPPNDDRDAYRNTSASLHLGYDFSGGAALNLAHFYTQSKNESDATFAPATHQPYSENWIQNTRLTLAAPLTDFWRTTLAAGRSIDDNDVLDKLDATDRSDFRTTRNSASWQNDFRLGDAQTLTAGADYYKDSVDSSNVYTTATGQPVKSRDDKAVFGQYLADFGLVDLQLGLRSDDIEDFDRQNTGNIAVGFDLPAQQKLIASYGTGFKAPTFNDLYWPIDPYSYGNPNLKAETSKNYELEWRGEFRQLRWAVNVFENKIKNLIDWAPISPTSYVYTPSNVADVRIRGAEFTVNGHIRNWLVAASLNYVDPRDDATDNLLTNRARRSVKLDADRQAGAWSYGFSWRAQDYRYADATNTQRMAGYGLVDVRAGYTFSPHWSAQLKLDNIFDKNYEIRQGYKVERFGAFATVTYRL